MRRAALTLILAAAAAAPSRADDGRLVEEVRKAIDRGVGYMRREQKADGSWEIHLGIANVVRGGPTALATLALLNAGVPVDDRMMEKALAYLRKQDPTHTYLIGLHAMVFSRAGLKRDLPRVQRHVDTLIRNRVKVGGRLRGWTYTRPADRGGRADNSNTQYALLGLNAGWRVGAKVPDGVWREIREFYRGTQTRDGGWGYTTGDPAQFTMTVAGFCGLNITGAALNPGEQGLDLNTGVARNCGRYADRPALARGLAWFSDPRRFGFRLRRWTYYNVYGIERAGRLSGRRFFGTAEFDWYREGCRFLTVGDDAKYRQRVDGFWEGAIGDPIITTSFALLFLSKGRTPIVVSKLRWGDRPDSPPRHSGWDNKRYDAENLAAFAGRDLFEGKPLAWQTYAPRFQGPAGEAAVRDQAEQLLASPLLYITGHKAITAASLPAGHRRVLKKYVEEGGFILAEACCGSPEFTVSFKRFVKETFGQGLRPLPKSHPVWTTPHRDPVFHFNRPDDELLGLEMGCKTVIVFSPRPLAGYWEDRRLAPKPGGRAENRAEAAYLLGSNVVAYATGLERPKPRLTEVEIAVDDRAEAPRTFLKVAQLKHGGDWEPAPRAMRNLMFHVKRVAKVDASLDKETLPLIHPDLYNFKFLYMHGRRRFDADAKSLTVLRANLRTGATLFADACCGREDFDGAFRGFVKKLLPDGELERIPPDDPLFGADLNGEAIRFVKCRLTRGGDAADLGFKSVRPFLEGVKVGGRWAVIYSKYDIGCALEKHKSPECLGYDNESALRLGTAAVLYTLKN